MKNGRVIAYNSDRGFGWLRNTEGGPDLFVHISEFPQGYDPIIGQDVKFEILFDERRGKPRAVKVRPI